MTRSKFFIQFRLPKSRVIKELPAELSQKIAARISDGRQYSVFEATDEEEVFNRIISSNRQVDGKSLIRLTRVEPMVDLASIESGKSYEVELLSDVKVSLSRSPKAYYEFEDVCDECGYLSWKQGKQLELKSGVRGDMCDTDNGEILVKNQLGDELAARCAGQVKLLETNQRGTKQLVVVCLVSVATNAYYQEKDRCRTCGRPRNRFLENSNGVALAGGDGTLMRQERHSELSLAETVKTIAVTEVEFGTLGRIPEGVTGVDPMDVGYKTSWRKIIASSEVARLLLRHDVKGLKLSPVATSETGIH